MSGMTERLTGINMGCVQVGADNCLDGMWDGRTCFESGWVHVERKGKARCRKPGIGARNTSRIEALHDKREGNMRCSEML